jgi:voltage-gated potassium channel
MNSRPVRRLILVMGLLCFTLAVGTFGFAKVEGYSWFDAFYMTLTTITTVGYQELKPLSHAGRIFNSFLILFGVSAIFLAMGAITQTIIEFELRDSSGVRRRRRMLRNLHMHFIVCGFGRVGRNASFQLQQQSAPFVVLDRDKQRIEKATNAGMLAMIVSPSL